MNRRQLENLYLVNGIGDFELRNLGDLMKVHGINARTVAGYSELSEKDKKDFETFIINIFNAQGLEARIDFIPEKVYRAENVEYLIKEEDDDCYLAIAGEVWNVSDKENKIKVDFWGNKNKAYKDKEVIKETSKDYLRFEYKNVYGDRWLHIINSGKEWY